MKNYIQNLILDTLSDRNLWGKDWTLFDVTDMGANLLVVCKEPSIGEALQFWVDSPIEVRMTEFKDVVFFSIKIGAMDWMDAPYSIHLSKNLHCSPRELCGDALKFSFWFADSDTGAIIGSRKVIAPPRFSEKFFKVIDEQLKWKDFNREVYDEKITEVYMKYSIKQLKDLSSVYFRA